MSNNTKGKSFESKVASLFSLLGYSVQGDLLIGGRQVDLFIEDKSGPLVRQYVVECKDQATPVTTAQYDSFCGRLRVAKSELGPKLRGIIVSSVGFVKEAKAQSVRDEVELVSISELEKSVIDFGPYVFRLVQHLESDTSLSYFVEPNVVREHLSLPQPAYKILSEWLIDPLSNQMTLLGDYGTGKTTLLRHLALDMARRYQKTVLEEGARGRVPIFVDLRDYTQAISLKQIILDLLDTHSVKTTSYAAFEYLLTEGQVLLILDGFDEMASRGNYQVTLRNFRELNRVATGRAKIILSCRTHYFTTARDVQRFHGRADALAFVPKSYTDLYREIANRPNFVITYLTEFVPSQVDQYLIKRCGDDWTTIRSFINSTYNLTELSERPVLLEMIVSSANKIKTNDTIITPGFLYQIYTDMWLCRNDWNTAIDVSLKMELLEHFAFEVSLHPNSQMYYQEIPDLVRSWDAKLDYLNAVEVDRELRTASFLVRDDSGYYRFSHRSFQEFFYSRYLLSEVKREKYEYWAKGYFRTEVYRFLRDLLPSEPIVTQRLLQWIRDTNTPYFARANAIKCLAGLNDENLPNYLIQILESNSDNLIVKLAAATALGHYPRTDVVNAIIRTASGSNDPYLVSNLLCALGKSNTHKGKAFLLGVLDGTNVGINFGAIAKVGLYSAAVEFEENDLVAACIRNAPLDSSDKSLLKKILDLCKSRWSDTARQYCINFLQITKKPTLATMAFGILSKEDREPFISKIISMIESNDKASVVDALIIALSGSRTDKIKSILCHILNTSDSFRVATAALKVLTIDYPDTVLANACEWMKPGKPYPIRLAIVKEYARRVAPNGIEDITHFLSPKERAKTKIEVLSLIHDYYPSEYPRVVEDIWGNEPAPRVKRHALELLYNFDRERALRIALEQGIKDTRVGSRVAVTSILGADTSNYITSILLDMLRKDDSKWVRMQALRSLCSPGRSVDRTTILEASRLEVDKDIIAFRRELIGA